MQRQPAGPAHRKVARRLPPVCAPHTQPAGARDAALCDAASTSARHCWVTGLQSLFLCKAIEILRPAPCASRMRGCNASIQTSRNV